MKTVRIGATLLASVAAISLFACGSSFDDYCTKRNNCLGGNDKDKQACIDSAESVKQKASDYGCSDQFKALQDCVVASGSCSGGQFMDGNCDSQNSTLNSCEQGASGEKGTH